MRNLFDRAEEAFRKNAHILVNRSGVLDPKFPFLENTFEQAWDWTLDINYKGAFLCCRESTNRLIKGGGGWIINITSSIVGSLRSGHTSYAVSNAVVDTMTKILTAYIAPYVNIVHFSLSTIHLLLPVTDNNPHPHFKNTFDVTMVYEK
ncbi:hypothetical protein KI387_033827, partial [Taxus chinensis]